MPSSGKADFTFGTIGHLGHGKTVLTAALYNHCTCVAGGDQRDLKWIGGSESILDDQGRVHTVRKRTLAFATPRHRVLYFDTPGHPDYLKNALTGMAQMDYALLVVDCSEGPKEQTLEHLFLARTLGIRDLIVFLSKVDLAEDPELVDMAETITREQLNLAGWQGDDTTFIRGPATNRFVGMYPEEDAGESITRLVQAIDGQFTARRHDTEGPFRFSIDAIISNTRVNGGRHVVTGRIEQGRIQRGARLELLGQGREPLPVMVTGLRHYESPVEEAEAGDCVGIQLTCAKDEVERGMMLATPGSLRLAKRIRARLSLLAREEQGRKNPLFEGCVPVLALRTATLSGRVSDLDREMWWPGETATASIEFVGSHRAAVEEGRIFPMLISGRVVGMGEVVAVEG